MEYTHYGDIILGYCNEDNVCEIIEYIKQKCSEGIQIYLKIANHHTYYLSVPIRIGSLQNRDDPMIYVHPCISPHAFYFIDLDYPSELSCITYCSEKKSYISNDDREGCVQEDIEVEESLYEITTEYIQEYRVYSS